MVAAAEYSEYFSESDQFAYQEASAVISDFNHPGKDYVNYISTDLSAGTMVKAVVDGVLDSNIGSSFKYCFNTNIIFSCYHSRTGRP